MKDTKILAPSASVQPWQKKEAEKTRVVELVENYSLTALAEHIVLLSRVLRLAEVCFNDIRAEV